MAGSDTTAMSFSANKVQETPRVKYARFGGGNLEYVMTLQGDTIIAHVTAKQFKEANDTLLLYPNETDSSTIQLLRELITQENKEAVADTTPKPGMMCTGTWTHAYILRGDSTEQEIFDRDIVRQIGKTEDWVRAIIEADENKKSEE